MNKLHSFGLWLIVELGLQTVRHAPRDVHLVFATRFLRMFAYGGAALILALFFAAIRVSDERIGVFMTLTLLGDVGVSLLLTLVADALGRRRILLLGCACMALSGGVFAVARSYWVLLVAAVVGVISPSGSEIGPFRAVEESSLAHLVSAEERNDVFAWYVVLGNVGMAGGFAACGWLVEQLKGMEGWTELDAYRVVFGVYGAIGLVKGVLTLALSPACELEKEHKEAIQEPEDQYELAEPLLNEDDEDTAPSSPTTPRYPPPAPPTAKSKSKVAHLSSATRWTLLKLCSLFAIDSLASGMVPYSLINYYLDRKFQLPKSALGTIMSSVYFCSSASTIFAGALSRRIGLIQTMVFTHLPSAVFLMLLPAASQLWLTVIFLAGRAALASMDQAPRSAFLSAVVLPEERTAVMGIVNVVKTLSASGGPSVTGVLAGRGRFWIAFVVAGAMKAAYDVGLAGLFMRVKLRERGRGGEVGSVRRSSESEESQQR